MSKRVCSDASNVSKLTKDIVLGFPVDSRYPFGALRSAAMWSEDFDYVWSDKELDSIVAYMERQGKQQGTNIFDAAPFPLLPVNPNLQQLQLQPHSSAAGPRPSPLGLSDLAPHADALDCATGPSQAAELFGDEVCGGTPNWQPETLSNTKGRYVNTLAML